MNDTSAALPPRFVFALFGRRRAGKSVLMAALRAVRRPQVGGVRISYVGALPPILRDNTEAQDDAERKRIEAAYIEASDALSDGRVPVQTAIADGIMGHRFELTLPEPPAPGASVRLHVDIYDYAGELLAISQDDETAVNTLHSVLRDTDGLLILAETPMKGIDPAAHRESLSGVSALGEALSRLGAKDRGDLRQAALLATKWDHQHPFICERAAQEPMAGYLQRLAAEEQHHATLFADWLTTDPTAEQHHLLDTRLRALFGPEEYRSYPVSAFGKARFVDIGAVDGSQAEVPAIVPLASLNLDEPILFMVDRARARQRRDLLAKADGPAEAIGAVPDRAALIALHGEDAELLKVRDELAARLDQLERERETRALIDRQRGIRRKVGLGALCALAVAGGGVWFDANRTLQLESTVQNHVANAMTRNQLDAVIVARDALFELAEHRPVLPTVRVLGLGYAPEQRTADLTALTAAECELWADRAKKPGFDVERGRVRLETLPGCGALDGALREAHLQRWKDTLRSGMDDFGRLTSKETCSAEGLVASSVSDKRNELLAHIDAAPNEAKVEARQTREKIDALETSCKQHQAEAAEARAKVAAARARAAAQEDRERELKKLDFTSLQAGKWAEYVKGLALFSKERVGAPPEDLEARTAETRRRLDALVTKLTSWHEKLPKDGTYNPAIALAITNTEDQIGALPANFQVEKERLFKVITEIKTDLQIWEACSAFDRVNAIYMDISGNLGSRTEARKQDLSKALADLSAKSDLKDHVSDGLASIEAQIGTIMGVKVERVTLSGVFPNQNNDKVEMKWQFQDMLGSKPEQYSNVKPDGQFTLEFVPGSTMQLKDDARIFVILTETAGWNHYYALAETVDLGTLLTGTSGLQVAKEVEGTLHETDGEVTSSQFSPSSAGGTRADVNILFSVSGAAGPTITPKKCASTSRSAANASDL